MERAHEPTLRFTLRTHIHVTTTEERTMPKQGFENSLLCCMRAWSMEDDMHVRETERAGP